MKRYSLKNKKGASTVTGLVLFLLLLVVFGFLTELYILYTLSSKVKDSVERSIRDVTTLNEVRIFPGLRENNFQLTSEQIAGLITLDELEEYLSEDLGLDKRNDGLYKSTKQGGYNYKIRDLSVNSVYYDDTNTLCFEAEGWLDVPAAVLAYAIPDISVKFNVRSMYSSKMRAEESMNSD